MRGEHLARRLQSVGGMEATEIKTQITMDDVEIEVFAEEECASIRGNCMASGDDAIDEECALEIERQLEGGNPWAWCTVRVRLTYEDALTADAYLGGCSYQSEKDFRSDAYFAETVAECLEDLNRMYAEITKTDTNRPDCETAQA